MKLYNPKHVLLHAYAGPFVVLYGLWLTLWGSWAGEPVIDLDPKNLTLGSPTENGTLEEGPDPSPVVDNFMEAGFIGLAVIGILQTLVYLFCHWSVHVRALLTCTRVKVRGKGYN